MKQEDILPAVQEAVAKRPAASSGGWWLTWRTILPPRADPQLENHIIAQLIKVGPKPEIVFFKFHAKQATDGFSNTDWDLIHFRILQFLKQKGLITS